MTGQIAGSVKASTAAALRRGSISHTADPIWNPIRDRVSGLVVPVKWMRNELRYQITRGRQLINRQKMSRLPPFIGATNQGSVLHQYSHHIKEHSTDGANPFSHYKAPVQGTRTQMRHLHHLNNRLTTTTVERSSTSSNFSPCLHSCLSKNRKWNWIGQILYSQPTDDFSINIYTMGGSCCVFTICVGDAVIGSLSMTCLWHHMSQYAMSLLRAIDSSSSVCSHSAPDSFKKYVKESGWYGWNWICGRFSWPRRQDSSNRSDFRFIPHTRRRRRRRRHSCWKMTGSFSYYSDYRAFQPVCV